MCALWVLGGWRGSWWAVTGVGGWKARASTWKISQLVDWIWLKAIYKWHGDDFLGWGRRRRKSDTLWGTYFLYSATQTPTCYFLFNLIGIFITISQTQILLHYYLSLVFITQVCTCVFYYCFPPFLHVKYMRDSYICDSCSWGTVLHETWFAHQASICYKEPTLQRQQHSQEAYLQCPKQCLNSMAAEVLTTWDPWLETKGAIVVW